MKQTIIKCDICGKEGGVRSMHLPVFRTFDETDGRTFYDEPEVEICSMDICPCCLRKATNIHDRRVQGYGDINIEKNPELFKKED